MFLFAVVCSAVFFFFFFFFFIYLAISSQYSDFSNFILCLSELSSFINDCVACLYQFPDPAKVSDPVEDYMLSLHPHFSIHQTTCVSKLHLKIFAKTTLAASVTNALFELCSDVIKGR